MHAVGQHHRHDSTKRDPTPTFGDAKNLWRDQTVRTKHRCIESYPPGTDRACSFFAYVPNKTPTVEYRTARKQQQTDINTKNEKDIVPGFASRRAAWRPTRPCCCLSTRCATLRFGYAIESETDGVTARGGCLRCIRYVLRAAKNKNECQT